MAKLKPTPRSNSSDAHEYIDISQTSDTDDAPQDLRPEPSPVPAKGSKTKAYDIRFFFPPFEGDGGMQICKICKAKADSGLLTGRANYKYMSTTASTNLRNHLFKLHEAEYLVEAAKNGWQTTVKPSKQPGAKGDRPPFTMENFISHLLRFIVADDQSINVIECREFRDLILLMRQELNDSDIPHRTKITESILVAWNVWFETLKKELAESAGKISCTADMWSNKKLRSFFAVTAHWLAKQEGGGLVLKAALIGFKHVPGKHDGKTLARTALYLIDRAGITRNVGHWTLDNASNNETFMESLADLLNKRGIPCDPRDARIRCFPHIINLCAQRVIRKIGDMELEVDEDDENLWESDSEDGESVQYAGQRDPLATGRKTVRAIRSAGQRREAFQQAISAGNQSGLWNVKQRELLHDVQTRWDSVYKMINRLRDLRPPLDTFLINHKELSHLRLSDDEWDTLEDIEIILGAPHVVQQLMSNENTPVLSGSLPSFELFMTRWEVLAKNNPRLKPWIGEGLKLARKYYKKMDHTKAHILAMVLNPAVRMSWIENHWDEEYIQMAKTIVKDTMREYRQRRQRRTGVAVPEPGTSSTPRDGFYGLSERYGLPDDLRIGYQAPKEQSLDQEYNAYVGGKLETSSHSDAQVIFWQGHEGEMPTWYDMALDYLPIQASAVPCERVFSSSAETDTKKRNRISPLLMEALQMFKFFLKKERLVFTSGWMTSEGQMQDNNDPEEDNMMDEVLKSNHRGDSQDMLDKVIAMLAARDKIMSIEVSRTEDGEVDPS